MRKSGLTYQITAIGLSVLGTLFVGVAEGVASSFPQPHVVSLAANASPTALSSTTWNEQESTAIPEPETILGCALALGVGALIRKEFIERNSK
jgi:hypothetical protein